MTFGLRYRQLDLFPKREVLEDGQGDVLDSLRKEIDYHSQDARIYIDVEELDSAKIKLWLEGIIKNVDYKLPNAEILIDKPGPYILDVTFVPNYLRLQWEFVGTPKRAVFGATIIRE